MVLAIGKEGRIHGITECSGLRGTLEIIQFQALLSQLILELSLVEKSKTKATKPQGSVSISPQNK